MGLVFKNTKLVFNSKFKFKVKGNFNVLLITTAGNGIWQKPFGVTEVIVECWGGGGPGGGSLTPESAGGGGAGGQYARKSFLYSAAPLAISYTVADIAPGSISAGSGNDTYWDTNQVVAKGGSGGNEGSPFGAGYYSTGGIGSTLNGIGDVVYAGGNGSDGIFLSFTGRYNCGSGGGGAGSTGPGLSAGFGSGGSGADEYGGFGATGEVNIFGGTYGTSGFDYGGGGSGCACDIGGYIGGPGAQGLIRIRYR